MGIPMKTEQKLEMVFSESQVMMLLEEFNNQIRLIREGIARIDRKLDAWLEQLENDRCRRLVTHDGKA